MKNPVLLSSPVVMMQRMRYNEAARETDSFGLDAVIALKARAFFSDTEAGNLKEVQAGVRAEKVEEEIGWIDDTDTSLLLESGRQKMSKGDYEGAIGDFSDAVDYSTGGDEAMFMFYIGYCYEKLGKEARALTYLKDIAMSADLPLYPDYVILYGKLLVKNPAYEEARVLFTGFFSHSVETDK